MTSVIGVWIRSVDLQPSDIAAFKQKVLLLKQYGPDLPAGLLTGPLFRHIRKFRVNTPTRALRPMICVGPIDNDAEFTFLFGAVERDGELDPVNAPNIADENRLILLRNMKRRRFR